MINFRHKLRFKEIKRHQHNWSLNFHLNIAQNFLLRKQDKKTFRLGLLISRQLYQAITSYTSRCGVLFQCGAFQVIFFLYIETPKLFFIFQGKSTRYFKPVPTNTHFFRRAIFYHSDPLYFICSIARRPLQLTVGINGNFNKIKLSHCKKLC